MIGLTSALLRRLRENSIWSSTKEITDGSRQSVGRRTNSRSLQSFMLAIIACTGSSCTGKPACSDDAVYQHAMAVLAIANRQIEHGAYAEASSLLQQEVDKVRYDIPPLRLDDTDLLATQALRYEFNGDMKLASESWRDLL